jgi:hypothetical protein
MFHVKHSTIMERESDMNSTIPQTWVKWITDADGVSWTFSYRGGSVVRIKPELMPPGHWTNSISLDMEGIRPEAVTTEWLERRTAEWITDRNTDLASGLYS